MSPLLWLNTRTVHVNIICFCWVIFFFFLFMINYLFHFFGMNFEKIAFYYLSPMPTVFIFFRSAFQKIYIPDRRGRCCCACTWRASSAPWAGGQWRSIYHRDTDRAPPVKHILTQRPSTKLLSIGRQITGRFSWNYDVVHFSFSKIHPIGNCQLPATHIWLDMLQMNYVITNSVKIVCILQARQVNWQYFGPVGWIRTDQLYQ